MQKDNRAIVIDCGSLFCRCGFSDDSAPKAVFRTFVGRNNKGEFFVGDDAQSRLAELATLNCPIERGIITDWDDMERIWNYIFRNILGVSPSDHPVLLMDGPENPIANREKAVKVMLDRFQVPAVSIVTNTFLSLYNSGRTTGLVIESGESATYFVPIYDGKIMNHAIMRMGLDGRDLTDHVKEIMKNQWYSDKNIDESDEIFIGIKENFCKVALKNIAFSLDEKDATPPTTYRLPNSDKFFSAKENDLFKCAEALFEPSHMGRALDGIASFVHACVIECNMNVQKEMYASIVLSGGNMLFPGMRNRMQREIMKCAPLTTKVQVVEAQNHSSWIGGATLASFSPFPHDNIWITKEKIENSRKNA